jgi:hypothetical protein
MSDASIQTIQVSIKAEREADGRQQAAGITVARGLNVSA